MGASGTGGSAGTGGGSAGVASVPPAPDGVATGLAVGGGHACAVLTDRTVRCWGSGTVGQLGDGLSTDSAVPVKVQGLTDVVQVAAGGSTTCAVLASGAVMCWGAGGCGALGNNKFYPNFTSEPVFESTPVAVIGISTAQQVSTNGSSTCARLIDGTVRCWGMGSRGELGDGVIYSDPCGSATPVDVSSIATAASVSLGSVSCALLMDGSARCWGWNYDGGLGNGDGCDDHASSCETFVEPSPVEVLGLSGAVQLSVGGSVCAVFPGGTVSCWGSTGDLHFGTGQLGKAQVDTPVSIPDFSNVVRTSQGTYGNCAVLATGEVQCLGRFPGLWPLPFGGAVAELHAGRCALLKNGAVQCGEGDGSPPVTIELAL
jgi:alpha-tubulin suppressor-like RCC1 family protein